jgi:hypothetical protein
MTEGLGKITVGYGHHCSNPFCLVGFHTTALDKYTPVLGDLHYLLLFGFCGQNLFVVEIERLVYLILILATP